jgi:cytochrome c oxidase assembly factor CtaG
VHPHAYAWTWNEEALVLGPALALGYAVAVRRAPPSSWRIACFATALVLVVAFAVTPLHAISVHYLLWIHLLQNVVLAEWAPLLLVLSLPGAAAVALTRPSSARRLTHPLVALPLWLATYAVWHVPAVYDAALRREHTLLHLEHLTYLGAGVLLWWPVLQDAPRRMAAGARALYVFAAFVLAAPIGLILALLPNPVYDVYEHAPHRLWGLSALADQQLGGVTMAGEQSVVFFTIFTYWFFRFLAEQEHAADDELQAVDPPL